MFEIIGVCNEVAAYAFEAVDVQMSNVRRLF